MMDRQQVRRLFVWTTAAVGAASCAWAAARLDASALDLPFVLLVVFTLGVGSRYGVRIPGVSGEVTVADTFIFLTLLLYGGQAAVLLGAAEGLCTSARFSSRKATTYVFNMGVMASSIFLASHAMTFCFGDTAALEFHRSGWARLKRGRAAPRATHTLQFAPREIRSPPVGRRSTG